MAWVYYRPRRWVLVSSILALALVVVAAVLGGAAVATELDWWVVLIHLGIAELVVACLVITSAAAWGAGKSPQKRIPRRRETDGFNLMVLATLVGAFILILSGSYMVGYGASSSCPTWPFCNGSLLPDGAAYAVHMGHRFTAAAVGVLIATTAVAAWRRRTERKELGLAAIAVTLIFGAQVLVGAATIWVGFASYMKAIHLSLATLVWIAVVFLAALVFLPQGIVLRRSAPGHRPVSQPQRLAS
jgi:protoheme IX farnesyltransferase